MLLMMLVDVGRWIASRAAHWPDLSVDIEYYHKSIYYAHGLTFTCSQLRHCLAAHDALFGLFSAHRTPISLYRDLRATNGPYGQIMPNQATC